MSALAGRDLRPEIMDDPHLDADSHDRALRGLARINAVSGSARTLWPALREMAEGGGAPLRVLDLATGAGDVPLRIWRRTLRESMPIEVHACDTSEAALDYARRRAGRANVHFFRLDAVRHDIPPDYDVLMTSLFLHHLSDDQAVGMLRRMKDAARRAVLVNDLRRSRSGLLLAQVATRVLTRSPIVHVDGPQSVRASFTMGEAAALAQRAGLDGARIRRCWPRRFVIDWRRP